MPPIPTTARADTQNYLSFPLRKKATLQVLLSFQIPIEQIHLPPEMKIRHTPSLTGLSVALCDAKYPQRVIY